MKTGIITFHFVNNFGGVLQTYALQEFIKDSLNSDVEIINYQNSFIKFTDTIRFFPLSTNLKEVLSGLQTFKERRKRLLLFKSFRVNHLFLSSEKYTKRNLKKTPPLFDKYVCGSDQIWNFYITLGIDPSYYLSFISIPDKKVAYAPSFGLDSISKHIGKKIRKLITNITYLSVREKKSQDIIQSLCNRSAITLIDPTFLLTKEQWVKISNCNACSESYILLYIMQTDVNMYEYVKQIKESLHIRIIEISRYGYQPDFIDEVKIDVGPIEFLSLFQNATCICTNSFHGLAFSLIFEKQCYLVPSKRFNIRIVNLLSLLHITYPQNINNLIPLCYDRDELLGILKTEREKAKLFLHKSLYED